MRTIFIISPQSWNHIFVSKHHYAVELAADKQAEVYYLSPPENWRAVDLKVNKHDKYSNLHIVEYSYPFPFHLFLRYKIRPLYNFLMHIFLKRVLLKRLPIPDEVWVFDANVYSDLSQFNAKTKIFFPVDSFEHSIAIKIAKSSSLIVTVSEMLMKPFSELSIPKLLLHHGLASHFEITAKKNLEKLTDNSKELTEHINACFFGNLLVPQIDHPTFKKIIQDNRKVRFHFWGTYKANTSEDTIDISNDFVSFLEGCSNVILHGPVSSEDLCSNIQKMDCFILCYNMNHQNKGNNSHKLMEALSTGKVIITNYFPLFEQKRELVVMPDDFCNDQLPELFCTTTEKLLFYNNTDLTHKRIRFALENTYNSNLRNIYNALEKQMLLAKK